jgi:hypothetical protein
MTKFMGLAVGLVATAVATLATPGTSEAGWRNRGCCCDTSCCYSYPVADCCQSNYGCCSQVVSGCCNTATTVAAPCCSTTYYYPTYGNYSSGYYSNGRSGYFSGYYRVGNVIINGRRWGDIGYRYSHGDLIRW